MAKKDKKPQEAAPETGTTAQQGAETHEGVTLDIGTLREEVANIVREKDEAVDIARRVAADFENYKKRNAQVRLDVEAETRGNVMLSILPVVDNMERALEAADADPQSIRKGVEMVLKQLRDTLSGQGVEEIPSGAGVPFDPEVHNAVATVPADQEHPDGTIFDAFQKGYRAGDKVIRYAMVRVAKDE